MAPKKEYYKLLSQRVIKGLEKRNMEGYYAENKEDAVKIVLSLMEEGSTVTWGGTMTLEEIGLKERLDKYVVYDRTKADSPEKADEICRKAFTCDNYIMSTNAITYDGELMNIDGMGNRVSALIYGPKNVIIIAGVNKITDNAESAYKRARSYASVPNVIRLDRNTPCKATGICHDCTSPDCICCQVVMTRFSRIKGRIKVVLVGEELGY